jgi:hypothetical protein
MAVYNDYTVEYYDDVAEVWVELNETNANVSFSSLSCFVGRQSASDSWQVSKTTINGRWFDSSETVVLSLVPGTLVRWFFPSGSIPAWSGLVTNLTVDHGLLSDGDSTPEDFVTIEAEGYLGVWGRETALALSYTNQRLGPLLDLWRIAAPPGVFNPLQSDSDIPDLPQSSLSFDVTNQSMLAFLTTAAESVQARIVDGVTLPFTAPYTTAPDAPGIYVATQSSSNQGSPVLAPVKFSDTTNDATNRVYFDLVFKGVADNYFNRVVVTPDQVAQQEVGTGQRTLVVNTYNASTTDAQSIGNILLVQFNTPSIAPVSLKAKTSSQHTQNLDTLGFELFEFPFLVSKRVQVDFRGETYYASIEGVSVSAGLDETVFTYYLTSSDAVFWFTLDSTEFGELDDDRLAYL